MKKQDDLYDLIRLVRPLYKVLEAEVARGLIASGLTVTERAVLEQLHDHGARPVPRVADDLLAPRQFIQKTANRLIDAGLVERQNNAAHRRSNLLALTATGAQAIKAILAREMGVTARVAADLDTGDIATAKALIAKMIDGYRNKETDNG